MTARKSKSRREMKEILRGGPGRLVILTIRDDIAFLNGREYVSEYTLSNWVETTHSIGADANAIVSLDEYLPASHPLGWKTCTISQTSDARIIEKSIHTPASRLTMEMVEQRGEKPARKKNFLEKESDNEDAIFGTELFNPSIIEEHNLRPARLYAKRCKELGLFSLMHSCGRTKLFLERGWFRGFASTIFESFTSAPLGDIECPREAADQLHPDTFFKGGLSLELMRNGTPKQVREAVRQAYNNFGHRRFILAGTCALLTGTPRENLEAIMEAALEFE